MHTCMTEIPLYTVQHALFFSLSVSRVIACCIHAISAPSPSLTFAHTHTDTCLFDTFIHVQSHTYTHRLLLSSFVKSHVCTHSGACSFDTFTHVHSLIHTHTHSLLRRMNPKRGAQEEVQQLAAFVSLPFPALLMRFAAFCSSTCSHYYYCCCCLFVFLIMRFGFINSYKAAAAYHAW